MKEYKTFELTDKETGEVISTTKAEIKPGTQVGIKATTEEQRDSYKHKLELNKEIKAFIEENEGVFVHLMFKYGAPIFRELEEKAPGNKCNTHVIRFMMLTTCLTFGGKLFDSNKNRVKKSSLKKIWDTTSKNSINDTYNLLKECGYIYETEEGYIMINEDLVIKGAIENFEELRKQDHSFTYTRVFIDNLREMYLNTEPKQRKQLANLFKILPYINFKYNVFCTNPTETDKKELDLLDWADLAKLCGYDKSQVARFKKDLMNLKIFGYDVIGEFNRSSGMTIIVNPKVHYGGDDTNDVRYLYDLFDMEPKK
jgi:hypothetical protein